MRNTTTMASPMAVQTPYAKPDLEPVALKELGVARGALGEIKPWSMGLILVVIGNQHVILPDELEKKLKRFGAGTRISVLRCGRYSVAFDRRA